MAEEELSQLVRRSPGGWPPGARRGAIPPMTAPRAKGVRIEETPKTVSTVRCSRLGAVTERMAQAGAPRRIPSPARDSPAGSVEAVAPNTAGHAGQPTTREKTGHNALGLQHG